MSSIELHPTLGVNPHMCMCPRCGKENGELMMIGVRTSILQCDCGLKIFGHHSSEPCPKCKKKHCFKKVGEIKENDKIPGNLCDPCEKEEEEHRVIVSEGGVYFRCKECGVQGVIRKSPLTDGVREQLKVEAPDPCGIEFQSCAEHTTTGEN